MVSGPNCVMAGDDLWRKCWGHDDWSVITEPQTRTAGERSCEHTLSLPPNLSQAIFVLIPSLRYWSLVLPTDAPASQLLGTKALGKTSL